MRWLKSFGLAKKSVPFFLLILVALPGVASAACLKNQSGRTVYVDLKAGDSGAKAAGNLLIGERFCVKTGKGRKALAKIFPYGGARFGCKTDIVGDETLVLMRFGTMNNCDFVPGK